MMKGVRFARILSTAGIVAALAYSPVFSQTPSSGHPCDNIGRPAGESIVFCVEWVKGSGAMHRRRGSGSAVLVAPFSGGPSAKKMIAVRDGDAFWVTKGGSASVVMGARNAECEPNKACRLLMRGSEFWEPSTWSKSSKAAGYTPKELTLVHRDLRIAGASKSSGLVKILLPSSGARVKGPGFPLLLQASAADAPIQIEIASASRRVVLRGSSVKSLGAIGANAREGAAFFVIDPAWARSELGSSWSSELAIRISSAGHEQSFKFVYAALSDFEDGSSTILRGASSDDDWPMVAERLNESLEIHGIEAVLTDAFQAASARRLLFERRLEAGDPRAMMLEALLTEAGVSSASMGAVVFGGIRRINPSEFAG